MKLNVIKAHAREFENPIAFFEGDRVQIGERSSDQWLGWVYCTAVDGCSGWVAEAMLEVEGEVGIAKRNYDAIEPSVETGWVPLEHLQEIQ
jgi:hypothetical protein